MLLFPLHLFCSCIFPLPLKCFQPRSLFQLLPFLDLLCCCHSAIGWIQKGQTVERVCSWAEGDNGRHYQTGVTRRGDDCRQQVGEVILFKARS